MVVCGFLFFFASVPCTLALGCGSYALELFVLSSVRARRKAHPSKSIHKARDFEEQSDTEILLLLFFFFQERVSTEKHPGVSHCPHLYKQPQPVDNSSACLGVARLA